MVDNREQNEITGSGPDRTTAAAAAEEEYWTPERRAAAQPVPPPIPSPEERETAEQAGQAAAPSTPSGQAGHLPPSPPPKELQDQGTVSPPEQEAEERQLSVGGNPVSQPLVYPYTTCGKIFFTQGGQDFAGSASVVAPNVLLTAGHCVFGGGAWSTNVAFYPSIRAAAPRIRPIGSPTTTSRPGRRGPRTATGPSTTEWCGSTARQARVSAGSDCCGTPVRPAEPGTPSAIRPPRTRRSTETRWTRRSGRSSPAPCPGSSA